MKKSILLICIAIFSIGKIIAQNSNCENLDFSHGDFTNWTGYTWINSTVSDVKSTQPALSFNMQSIMTDKNAYDSNTGNKLKLIPDGFNYSVRLGDLINNTSVATLRYNLTIDSTNALIIYRFAVVLLDPLSNHQVYEEPRFKMTLYDENGKKIEDCSNYDVYASQAALSGSFQTYKLPNKSDPVLWRDWTSVGADLSAYKGRTITIEFLAADCTHKQHFGYAYFVASCHPPELYVKYCKKDTVAILDAPEGFTKYTWTSTDGSFTSDKRENILKNPKSNVQYICTMTSATGCNISMKTNIVKYSPIADFDSEMVDCQSNIVKFINNSSTNSGFLSYKWDMGDGNFSYQTNPDYKFSTSGIHTVKLTLVNLPSVCADTLVKQVESFSPPLVGIIGDSTYCPGGNVDIKAYGAAIYDWSTGSYNDKLTIGAPGGNFWMVGHSTTGCISDTLFFKITEDPEWQFDINGKLELCNGDSTFLTAVAAYKYNWNTKDTTATINVIKSGNYKVTGTNLRGCKKESNVIVKVYEIPKVNFYVSPREINKFNKTVQVIINPELNVNYQWNMGDGSKYSETEFYHKYIDIDIKAGEYIITLIAENDFGCADTAYENVVIIPYFPDVFTPNNDGYNDKWFVDLSDYLSPKIEAAIFDRWGEKVKLSENDKHISWDGKFREKEACSGVYVYVIKSTDKNGQVRVFSGDVTLLR
jgi:gliding motility-associated-like protein